MKRKLLVVFTIIVLIASFLFGCVKETENNDQKEKDMDNPKVVINMLDGKKIRIELFPEYAPKTVENFLKLVDENFYDNTVFHRIIHNFMVQTGWIEMSDENKPIYKPEVDNVVGEFALNGFSSNTLSHMPGVISMARLGGVSQQAMNSGSGQFFICTGDASHLDGIHAAFGKVMDAESMENVINISQNPTGYYYNLDDFPVPYDLSHVIIASIERL